MEQSKNKHFYNKLQVYRSSVNTVLGSEDLFTRVPSDWYVVITDIENSTIAVNGGKHQLVNLIAAGSVIAALNVAIKEETDMPFFFGGDGATFLVPPDLLDVTISAVTRHKKNVSKSFGLNLRVGSFPVQKVYDKGEALLIAKVKVAQQLIIPVVLGKGLQVAERHIKSDGYKENLPDVEGTELDMRGMECRWDQIKPPPNASEVISLLVVSRKQHKQSEVFKRVLDRIDDAYGPQKKRQPITLGSLKLKASWRRMKVEVAARLGRFNFWYMVGKLIETFIGKFYLPNFKKGKEYLNNLLESCDTLVIDGRINTVITGTEYQRVRLTDALKHLEKEGIIYYGMHVSKASIMSCYVRDRNENHIHFVDGAEGGYTRAAVMLKGKLEDGE